MSVAWGRLAVPVSLVVMAALLSGCQEQRPPGGTTTTTRTATTSTNSAPTTTTRPPTTSTTTTQPPTTTTPLPTTSTTRPPTTTTTTTQPPTTTTPLPTTSTSRPPTTTTTTTRAPTTTTAAPRLTTDRAVLIGDSMADESRRELAAAAQVDGVRLTMIVKDLAAPCSQTNRVLTEMSYHPAVVAVEWVGNARFTAGCTTVFEVDEVVAEYRAALDRIVRARPPGTVVALVGIPPITQYPWSTTWQPLDVLYRQVAAREGGVVYIDAALPVAPARRFTRTVACDAHDRTEGMCARYGAPAGQVVVRDPIGFHFCPVRYDTAECPITNPGARRYATTITAALSRYTG